MDSLDFNVLRERHSSLDGIDEELYLSLLIVLISDRNLLVSSTNEQETIDQISFVLTHILDLPYCTIDCALTEQVAEEDDRIVVLRGVDKTSAQYQAKLKPLFDEKIVILVIPSSEDGYEVSLIYEINDKILFRYPHNIPARDPFHHFRHRHTDANFSAPNAWQAITLMNESLASVKMIQEISRYINDIVVFIRNHRMVVGGVSFFHKQELDVMIRTIAVINRLNYVTPAIVKVACEKFFPLHLDLIPDASKEPTLIWGSDRRLVNQLVEKWDQDSVMADVLMNVQPPM